MNIISREQLEYLNHYTQQCPYNVRVGVSVRCNRSTYACSSYLILESICGGPPTDTGVL